MTKEELLKLLEKKEADQKAYYGHDLTNLKDLSLEERLQFDIEERRLAKASSDSNLAYLKALEEYKGE